MTFQRKGSSLSLSDEVSGAIVSIGFVLNSSAAG